MEEEIDWDQEAENWTKWARTPGHDASWHYRDRFFDEIVPPAGRPWSWDVERAAWSATSRSVATEL
jgi:hypothetical protein